MYNVKISGAKTKNQLLLNWIKETAELCKRYAPPRVVALQLEGPESAGDEITALDGVVSIEKHTGAEAGLFACKVKCEEGADPRRVLAERPRSDSMAAWQTRRTD